MTARQDELFRCHGEKKSSESVTMLENMGMTYITIYIMFRVLETRANSRQCEEQHPAP